jgi:hypothetical protein
MLICELSIQIHSLLGLVSGSYAFKCKQVNKDPSNLNTVITYEMWLLTFQSTVQTSWLILEAGATIHQTDILCRPLKPEVDAEGFLWKLWYCSPRVHARKALQEDCYRNILHHVQEAVQCEHPHLLEPGKTSCSKLLCTWSLLVQENLTNICFNVLSQLSHLVPANYCFWNESPPASRQKWQSY